MSFPRYPHYKPSGVEWLGEVPEHWEMRAIWLLFELGRGRVISHQEISDNPGEYPVYSSQTENDGIMGHIGNFEFSGDYLTWTTDGANAGTVFRRRGKFNCTNVCGTLKAKTSEIHLDYAWRTLCISTAPFIRHDINPKLMNNVMARIRIPLPPLSEQIEISVYIDRETAKIDALVAEQQRLIELLKEKRQAVISHAVTKGLDPTVPMKPSGIEWLGAIPAHWQTMPLKRVADVQTGVAKGKDHGSRRIVTVPYLRVANVQDGYLDLETVATIDIPEEELERYLLNPGDVLMNEGGDFDKLGRGCVWDGQIQPCITQNHVFAVRPRRILSNWLNAITSSGFAQFYFMTRSKQSTNLASISSTNLMELPVLLPPEDEQERIVSFIVEQTTSFDNLTAEAERAIELLRERRTALISAAVTGQIDVRQLAQGVAA